MRVCVFQHQEEDSRSRSSRPHLIHEHHHIPLQRTGLFPQLLRRTQNQTGHGFGLAGAFRNSHNVPCNFSSPDGGFLNIS